MRITVIDERTGEVSLHDENSIDFLSGLKVEVHGVGTVVNPGDEGWVPPEGWYLDEDNKWNPPASRQGAKEEF